MHKYIYIYANSRHQSLVSINTEGLFPQNRASFCLTTGGWSEAGRCASHPDKHCCGGAALVPLTPCTPIPNPAAARLSSQGGRGLPLSLGRDLSSLLIGRSLSFYLSKLLFLKSMLLVSTHELGTMNFTLSQLWRIPCFMKWVSPHVVTPCHTLQSVAVTCALFPRLGTPSEGDVAHGEQRVIGPDCSGSNPGSVLSSL